MERGNKGQKYYTCDSDDDDVMLNIRRSRGSGEFGENGSDDGPYSKSSTAETIVEIPMV